jgi:hypothetical protein
MQLPLSGSAENFALRQALQQAAPHEPLEAALNAVESQLDALYNALCERQLYGIDLHSKELHKALAHALDIFSSAARHGGVPRELRERLMRASAQVAAQREALARATAALDRALDVLLPSSDQPVVYADTRKATGLSSIFKSA